MRLDLERARKAWIKEAETDAEAREQAEEDMADAAEAELDVDGVPLLSILLAKIGAKVLADVAEDGGGPSHRDQRRPKGGLTL